MTRASLRLTEKQFQDSVIQLARALKWKVAHHHDSRREVRPGVFVGDQDAAGLPDLFLCHPQHGCLWRELKATNGRLSSSQEAWLKAINDAGGDAECWRPEDWPRIEQQLMGADK